MLNFLNKHKVKIIIIAVIILIVGALVWALLVKYNNRNQFENTHHVIIITINPTNGSIVPVECDYYSRTEVNGVLYFYGISPMGTHASLEIDRRFIIMISVAEVIQLKAK